MAEAPKPSAPREQTDPYSQTRPAIDADGVSSLESVSSGTPPPSRSDLYLGKTMDGRYLVERVLGEGGMGIVYAGRHKVIVMQEAWPSRSCAARDGERRRADGEVPPGGQGRERHRQRVRRSSTSATSGQLPDGSTYLVMELLEGKGLGAAMQEGGAMPVPRLVHIAKQIAQGLGAAHAANIIHRDLKPDNVMLLIPRGSEKDFSQDPRLRHRQGGHRDEADDQGRAASSGRRTT